MKIDIKPFGAGQIICNGLDAPINLHFYVSSGAECVAKPDNGFEFDRWFQIFDGNSTRTINASKTSVSPWTSFLEIFGAKLVNHLPQRQDKSTDQYYKSTDQY